LCTAWLVSTGSTIEVTFHTSPPEDPISASSGYTDNNRCTSRPTCTTTPPTGMSAPPQAARAVKRSLSGLAKQAFSLHRDLLRAVRSKAPEARVFFAAQIREAFETHRRLDPRDIFNIEHRIRHGRKQLELLRSPSVTGAHLTSVD